MMLHVDEQRDDVLYRVLGCVVGWHEQLSLGYQVRTHPQ
jgi:hypothetical protein